MKRILATVIVTAALMAPALAADLGARTYAKAPAVAPAPVSNWSGLYVGGNLGYGLAGGTEIQTSRSCQVLRNSATPIRV